jgi:LacI family transcriptional regulator
VLPDLAGPFYGDLLMGYERWAGEHGQSVVITVTHGTPDPRRTVRDLAGRVDGIVVHGNALDLPTIQGLRKAGVPLVLIAHPPVTGCDSVRTESAASAEALTTRLLDHGRRNLLFVGDPASSYDVSERYAGFAKALRRRGIEVPKPVQVPLTEEAGRQVAEKVLQAMTRSPRTPREAGADVVGRVPDGLVCANDELALAALTTLAAHDVAVPDDIVVTGWDDVMAARYVSPGLTTVRQPMAELGQVAAERLHERVTGERTRARNDVLATQLVLRDSCGTGRGISNRGT